MICDFDAFSITGSICFGSPPRTTTFPPNGISKAFVSFSDNMSLSDLSRASKHCRFVINASSHIMRSVCVSNSAIFVPRFISHIDNLSMSIGIRNREWVVRPFGSNKKPRLMMLLLELFFFLPLDLTQLCSIRMFCQFLHDRI